MLLPMLHKGKFSKYFTEKSHLEMKSIPSPVCFAKPMDS